MRRQPGSGISLDDTVRILRFLSYYSRERKAKKLEPDASAPPYAESAAETAPEAGAP